MAKRILLLSDFHCGHKYGLAVPDECVNDYQRKAWEFFEKGIKQFAPYDTIFCNGDLIDGAGEANKGVELITSDRLKQSDMAINVLKKVLLISNSPPKMFFTRGTPYHTGKGEDYENVIAKEFWDGGKKNIDETLLVDIGGVIFDLKHKISGSSNAAYRVGAPAKLIVNAMLEENYQDRPKADCFIRSHVHYHTIVGLMDRVALTTPGLQINSSFGQRQCSGIIDFGFVVIDVDKDKGKGLRVTPYICKKSIKQVEVLKG